MSNRTNDVIRILVPEDDQLRAQFDDITEPYLDGENVVTVSQEEGDTFLHLGLADASALREKLGTTELDFHYSPPFELTPEMMGMEETASALVRKLEEAGVEVEGLGSDSAPATAVKGQDGTGKEYKLTKAESACTKMEEIASGYAEGNEGEVTVIGGVEPATYDAAINEAYAAAIAAATEKASFDDCKCVKPCKCQYVYTFKPEATQTTQVVTVQATASGKKAAVAVSASIAGGWTNVTAWVRWTLWKACFEGAEANGLPSQNPDSGSINVGGQTVTSRCPTRVKSGRKTIRRNWSFSRSWRTDDATKDFLNAKAELRKDVARACAKAAGAAIDKLPICPTNCPKVGDLSFLITPVQVTSTRIRETTGIASYWYESSMTGSAKWSVFKRCVPG